VSSRAERWALWLGLVLVVPLPMAWIEPVRVPAARYLELGLVCGAVLAVEGAGGVVGTLTALFLGHALAYAALLWGAAWLGLRAAAGLGPRARRRLVVVLVLAGVLGAAAFRIYRTPFQAASIRASLLEVYR